MIGADAPKVASIHVQHPPSNKMTRKSSPAYHTVSDSDASDFIPSPPAKRAKVSTRPSKPGQKRKPVSSSLPDIEDAVPRPHGSAYHSVGDIASHQASLLSWFEHVRYVPPPPTSLTRGKSAACHGGNGTTPT